MLLSNFLIFPDGSPGGCAVLSKDDNTFSGPKYAKHACQYFTRRHKADSLGSRHVSQDIINSLFEYREWLRAFYGDWHRLIRNYDKRRRRSEANSASKLSIGFD